MFSNGFTLIHEPSPTSLSVSYHFLLQAGSAHEPEALSGVSHFMEHMVFKGSSGSQWCSWNDQVEQLGGTINAFTSFEETSFQLSVSRRHWEEGLRIVLEMILCAKLDEEDFEKERKVILEELSEGRDSGDYLLSEKLWGSLYGDHGFGRPVIGNEHTIKSLSLDALRDYYQKVYQPHRMILAVAGPVDWSGLLSLLEESFQAKNHSSKTPFEIEEPKFGNPSIVRIHRGNHERVMEIAFPAPNVQHEMTPVLDVLSVILGDAETSRLYKSLRLEKEWVRSIGSQMFSQNQTGLFLIRALLNEGAELSCLKEIFHQIRKLKEEGVSGAELARAKLLIDKEIFFNAETLEGRTRTLAYFQHAFGAAEMEEVYRKRLLSVSEDDVQRAAEAYLKGSLASIAFLAPQHAKLPSDEDIRAACSTKKSVRAVSTLLERAKVTRWTLENGLRVVFREVPESPVTGIYALAPGGLRSETSKNNGISYLMASTVDRGTRHLSHEALMRSLMEHQADMGGFVGQSSQGARMEAVRSSFFEALKLFGEILFFPRFPQEAVEQEREIQLRELDIQQDYFEVLATQLFQQTLFGEHPYGLNLLGQESSLKDLNAEKLRERQQFILQPRSLVLGISGDHDVEELKDRIQELFGDLENRERTFSFDPADIQLQQIKELKRPIHGEKTYLNYGFLGPSRLASDRYAAEVLSAILSSSGGGRLYDGLREERGLVYSVDCTLLCGWDTGCLQIGLNTTPEYAQEAYREVREQLQRLKTEEVSDAELSRVKNYLAGIYELELQRSISQAAYLASGELFQNEKDLEDYPERIRGVSAEEIQEAARHYLLLDQSALVWLSPEIN